MVRNKVGYVVRRNLEEGVNCLRLYRKLILELEERVSELVRLVLG